MIKKPMKIDKILLSHISHVECTFITFRAVRIIFAFKIEHPNRLASPKQKLVQSLIQLTWQE